MNYVNFITNRFKNKEVHVVASGPSLLGFDYSKLNGKNIVTVNHAYKELKHDYCVFVDRSFVKTEDSKVIKATTCLSRKIKEYPSIIDFKFNHQFSYNPKDGVFYYRSSGISAITTALQGGASKIFLYGFDARFFNKADCIEAVKRNGADPSKVLKKDAYGHSTSDKNFHMRDRPEDEQLFKEMIQWFSKLPANKIINMSPFSAIPFFEKPKK